jgi:hypothetical protein
MVPTKSKDDVNSDVNRFFGYAVFGVLTTWRKKRNIMIAKENVSNGADVLDHTIAFIEGMRLLHKNAMLDDEYMSTCYAPELQVVNKGGLTLVSRDYFDIGRKLLTAIRKKGHYDGMKKHGSYLLEEIISQLLSDKRLENEFLLAGTMPRGMFVDRKIEQGIWKELIAKTYHAWIGAIFDRIQEDSFGRYAKKGADMALRSKLKNASRATSVKEAIIFDKTL